MTPSKSARSPPSGLGVAFGLGTRPGGGRARRSGHTADPTGRGRRGAACRARKMIRRGGLALEFEE
eukprot:765830-Hanusia_phi.AAC.8